MVERVGLYPGTFDPITTGHQDIIKRSLRVVDRLVVAVAVNTGKSPLFDVDERVALTAQDLAALGSRAAAVGGPQLRHPAHALRP